MATYRDLEEKDFDELRCVAHRAWAHAYRGIYSPGSIERKIQAYYSEASLAGALGRARSGSAFFMVAVDGGRIIGYANGGRIRNPWQSPSRRKGRVFHVRGWELYRIYLLPTRIGRGVGKALLSRWESFLRAKNAVRYYVTYNSRNKLARDFYVRNGFVRDEKYDDGPYHCAVKSL